MSYRAGFVNYSKALSGFDPDQWFSTTQLLAHSLPAGWGEEKWEGKSWRTGGLRQSFMRKEEERKRRKKNQLPRPQRRKKTNVMQNAVTQHYLTDAQCNGRPQPTPSTSLIENIMQYGIFLWAVWVISFATSLLTGQYEKWRKLTLSTVQQQLRCWFVVSTIFITNPKYSTVAAITKKINSIPTKMRTPPFSIPFTSCPGPMLSSTSLLVINC